MPLQSYQRHCVFGRISRDRSKVREDAQCQTQSSRCQKYFFILADGVATVTMLIPLLPLRVTCVFRPCHPQWDTADAEIKVPSVENPELTCARASGSLF